MSAPAPNGGAGTAAGGIEPTRREIEERYRAIVETAREGIWTLDTEHASTFANRALGGILGYEPQEMLGRSVLEFVDPADREATGRSLQLRREGTCEQFEVTFRAKDGREVWTTVATSTLRDSEGRFTGLLAMVTDISERRATEAERAREIGERSAMEGEIRHLGTHDWLTGLYNRPCLVGELDRCLDYSRRYRFAGAVLALDVDNFKLINDSKGHDVGDRTLKSVAQLLLGRARKTDIVARIGGDEFAVVLPEATQQDALTFAADIRALLCERAIGPPVYVSMGISLFLPDQEITANDALTAADIAQFEAKERGGDQAVTFDLRAVGTLTWVERIRSALAEDRFVIYGQPIVDLQTDRVACHELLIRMRAEDGEVIAPGEFLPTAEHFGLTGEIDRWVTRRGLHIAAGGERVTINLSGPSIGDEQLLGLVAEAVAEGLDPGNVIFEITETAAVSNFERAEQFVGRLNGIGCDLALDDFGTGFGSFTYLKHLKARYLKIDVDFVRDVVASETDQKVVQAIVEIAHSLGKETIAEGVEDAATLAALRSLGVDFAQGFYLGRPQTIAVDRDPAAAAEAPDAPPDASLASRNHPSREV